MPQSVNRQLSMSSSHPRFRLLHHRRPVGHLQLDGRRVHHRRRRQFLGLRKAAAAAAAAVPSSSSAAAVAQVRAAERRGRPVRAGKQPKDSYAVGILGEINFYILPPLLLLKLLINIELHQSENSILTNFSQKKVFSKKSYLITFLLWRNSIHDPHMCSTMQPTFVNCRVTR